MAYSEDIESSLKDKIVHFSVYPKIQFDKFAEQYKDEDYSKESLIHKFIIDHGLKKAFPNVEDTFRIYLSLMISNCTGERTFSKLSRIKNELRSTMTHNRLNNLSLMSIERDILNEINFDEAVETFATKKVRKKKDTIILFLCKISTDICFIINLVVFLILV